MTVVDLSISKKKEDANHTDMLGDRMREDILEYAKDFKTSWVSLGRHLYAIHQDKMFHAWGFEKFENYVEDELGLKKSLCLKLLKAYLFIETDEPQYLEKGFTAHNDTLNVPNYDAIDVLRTAKSKKELIADDYDHLRKFVFDKGKDAGEVRKELGVMMKERKHVDPEEERDNRNEKAIKKMISALGTFSKDMDALKLIRADLVEEAKGLMSKLSQEVE
ncbi:MAG: hypothetical protein ACI9F2_000597 [Lysobacterales bacterium]|jgi:hypothetical protein